eukprot:CAMPEP_0172900800 /NCGR_PEP_ID=MMETSP1075-20121228/164850_1 /TAXON_ID=2916 /ORGANISM="Ceratium fusus, Strain PA161109" /LENGTH=788 /DNA_ID=CAMNT_0013757063 /DNA_START=103 /DNA_END=2466 /DNA_ORIENTATION=-
MTAEVENEGKGLGFGCEGSIAGVLAAGNAKYAAGEYQAALRQYEEAVALLKDGDPGLARLYNNMAAAYLKLRQAKPCEEYSRKALSADPQNAKARSRLAHAIAASGRIRQALEVLSLHPSKSRGLDDLKLELETAEAMLVQGNTALEAGNFSDAVKILGKLEGGLIFDCPSMVAQMGQCYLALGDVQRALHVSSSLLRWDAMDVDAYLLRAEAQLQGVSEHFDDEAWDKNAAAALQTVRKALQLDPEHKAAAKVFRSMQSRLRLVQQLRAAMTRCEWRGMSDLLSVALGDTPGAEGAVNGRFKARCLAVRGQALLELGDPEACVTECRAASKIDNRLAAAPIHEAKALQKLERWEDAVKVLEGLHAWKKDDDIFWKVEWAKFEVRRVKRPDYYKILGVRSTASQGELKEAYRKQSIALHPDKQLQRDPDIDLDAARDRFTLLGEAYEIVGTPAKREYYDKGYDAQGIRECLQVRKRFQGQAPCSSCGEDESGKLGADMKWYCNTCWDRYYRDHPGETLQSDVNAAGSTQKAPGSNQTSRPDCRGPPPPCPDGHGAMSAAELQAILLAAQLGKANSCPTSPEELLAHLEGRLRPPASNGREATIPAPETEVSSAVSGTHASKVGNNSGRSGVVGATKAASDATPAMDTSEAHSKGVADRGTSEPVVGQVHGSSSLTEAEHIPAVAAQGGVAVQRPLRRAPPEMAASQIPQATPVEHAQAGKLAAATAPNADDSTKRHPAGFEWSFSLPTGGPRIHSLMNAQVLGAASFNQQVPGTALVSKPPLARGSFE